MRFISDLTKDNAIRQGLVFGGILGVFHIVFNTINNLMNLQGTSYAILNNSLLISLVLFLSLAGYATHQLKSGAKAGFTAGLVSALIGIITMWIITFLFMDVIARNTYMVMDFQRSGASTMNQFIVEDALGATAIEFVVSLVFGAFLGALGGWLGSMSRPKQAIAL